METKSRHEKQLELLKLMSEMPFDTVTARSLLTDIGGIDEPFMVEHYYATTFLETATAGNNYGAVKFLFDNGSDPNMLRDEDGVCPLDDLMFPSEEKAGNQERLAIAKLYFKHSADPNLVIDEESVYDYVTDEVFNIDFP